MLAGERAKKDPTAEDARAMEYLTKTLALTEMRVLSASLAKLPQTIIHPDPVQINIIATSETNWTLINWAGAGLGLRAFALGWVLVTSYMRSGGNIRVVGVILKGYHRMKAPGIINEEVDTLGKMAGLRMTNIRAWEVGVGKKAAGDVLKEVQMWFEARQLVSKRVREVLAKPRAMEDV
ncbi:hypothetical protein H072_9905 [Dactylellina haptotyla CBS 200.50]|uniref:Uncharacterized protein n=1 Tax=Dactylellina haptotyla (strain CBS 200.50) TaxID=1284197 RepID=S8BBS2_DACHA|nr:hypothetical protein H072_9905 [Dactylellina haptotyla CBS 200.50]